VSSATSVEVRRRLPAPPDEVFRWWTEPELMQKWMTPTGDVEASVDLRAGGALRVVMSGGGMVIEHVGTFLEIDRPNRLVFTWASRYTGPNTSLVTVEFHPAAGNATDLRITHTELPEEATTSHGGGWIAMLDRLEGALHGD
jgi:uncharacterized protein YndB with AHSA1/START domain